MAERKTMTEAEKKAANAERMRKARAAKKEQELARKQAVQTEIVAEQPKAEEKKLYDEETVRRMIAEALQAAQAGKPQVVQVQQEVKRVTMLWQAPVADYNVLTIGENGRYGRITGPTGVAYVPKDELSSVLDERMRKFIDRRWMLILDGLDESEKEALNCNYGPGEVLSREQFRNIERLGDQMLDVFPLLCKEHMEMVAQRYAESYVNGNPYGIKRELVVKLNDMSKGNYPGGLFKSVIERMNSDELGK